MAAVDIVRDRERGLPRYNQARRQYGLQPARTFTDITSNPMVRLRMSWRLAAHILQPKRMFVSCLRTRMAKLLACSWPEP